MRRVIGITAGIAVLAAVAPLWAASPAAAQTAPAAAAADPCKGPNPVAGVEIRGPVLHVIDGRTLCVALGFETDAWIRLTLADAPASLPVLKTSTAGAATPNPRGALMQAAMAKMADCRTVAAEDGSVEALCEVEGKAIGELLRDPNVVEASYGWR